ncbi:thermonuclease family protein [Rhizobium sp. BE258]|uniref:thermonuclease family protein n=1 Tax=Rhizobium sp. BE258 TaxID=2817722 RepID=UPI00285C01C5|nr:thermonuclease family protein [Rhizobium sp. BE258]MDR7143472.1 hypothetical protein [Rhizobium sp. BE258]
MRPAALLTAVAGIAIVTGMLAAGRERFSGDDGAAIESEAPAPAVLEAASAAPPPALKPPAPEISMSARPVDSGSQFYPAEVDGRPLERVAAPEPEKPKPEPKKGAVLPRPVAESAGVLAFGDRKLALAGILPTPDDKSCKDGDGSDWPCGMLAKTNFRLFLRLRSVTCDLDDVNWKGTATASCKIGTQDLSEWLAENGWAEAAPGSAFAAASETARADKKGIFGDDPRKGAPIAPPADPPPDDNPLDPT